MNRLLNLNLIVSLCSDSRRPARYSDPSAARGIRSAAAPTYQPTATGRARRPQHLRLAGLALIAGVAAIAQALAQQPAIPLDPARLANPRIPMDSPGLGEL